MPTFNAWDVIKVPFPYTDRQVRERRPAFPQPLYPIPGRNGIPILMLRDFLMGAE